MQLKTWFPIVSTAAAVLFCVLWLTGSCDKPVTPPSDDVLWRDQVAQRERAIADKDSIISAISQKRQQDSLKHLESVQSLKTREAVLVRKLKEANADIQVVADSLPKVARYIELADSTISLKDSLYVQELNHSLVMEKYFNMEKAQLGQKYIQQVEISKEYEARVNQLTDKNKRLEKRLERKTKFNRVLFGVTAGIGAALAITILTQ